MRPATADDLSDVGDTAGQAEYQTEAPSLEALGLSKRQTDVLAHLLKGLPNKIIAREMHISIETVKDHVAAVLKALKVSTRTQAVLAVSQMTQRGSSQRIAAWRRTQP